MADYRIKGLLLSEGELDKLAKLIIVYRCMAGRWASPVRVRKMLENLGEIEDE